MKDSLLRKIYDKGQEMASALQNDQVEPYFQLVEERGTLLEELDRYEHPSEIDPDWQEIATALQEQYQVLTTAIAAQERRMQEELAAVQRYKGASRSYQPSARPAQILNQNLHG